MSTVNLFWTTSTSLWFSNIIKWIFYNKESPHTFLLTYSTKKFPLCVCVWLAGGILPKKLATYESLIFLRYIFSDEFTRFLIDWIFEIITNSLVPAYFSMEPLCLFREYSREFTNYILNFEWYIREFSDHLNGFSLHFGVLCLAADYRTTSITYFTPFKERVSLPSILFCRH
jgi:hypothetical protein